MKTRFFGEEYELRLTCESSASSYGQPVLVTQTGEPIDPLSFAFHDVIEATDDEIDQLRKAGYMA